MRTIRVAITERLIAGGKRGSHFESPECLAINNVLAGGQHVTVSNVLGAQIGGVWCPYPEAARDWITRYDAGENPGPITFDLQVPHGRKDDTVPA